MCMSFNELIVAWRNEEENTSSSSPLELLCYTSQSNSTHSNKIVDGRSRLSLARALVWKEHIHVRDIRENEQKKCLRDICWDDDDGRWEDSMESKKVFAFDSIHNSDISILSSARRLLFHSFLFSFAVPTFIRYTSGSRYTFSCCVRAALLAVTNNFQLLSLVSNKILARSLSSTIVWYQSRDAQF